jgi:glucose/arabinose dehydrogenase
MRDREVAEVIRGRTADAIGGFTSRQSKFIDEFRIFPVCRMGGRPHNSLYRKGSGVPAYRGAVFSSPWRNNMKRTLCGSAIALMASAISPVFVFAQTSPINKGSITVTLSPFATIPAGDGSPQSLESANDGTGRLFVSTRNGDIDALNPNGTSAGQFLNMSSDGLSIYTDGEGGFPGLAFSPTFATDGKFYTFTTEPFTANSPAPDFSSPELAPTTKIAPANQTLIRQWTVSNGTVNPTSRVLIRMNHPESNHQGGELTFGPDGDLYFSIGDGGDGNDQGNGPTDPTDGHTNNIGNAQDTSVIFGKILRIDPNGNNSANGQYGIPASNPLAGQSGKVQEIYAYGLRNPYRFSFDSATGQLFAGDVGQNNREEVDIISNGGNFGWPFREGTRDNSGDFGEPTPAGFSSITPIAEYTHGDGQAIIGGFVYHGSAIPQLDGKYVFGDLGVNNVGRLFYMDASGGTISELNYNTIAGVAPSSLLYSFGEDQNGDLYAMFANGQILKFVPEPDALAAIVLLLPLLRRRRPRMTSAALHGR